MTRRTRIIVGILLSVTIVAGAGIAISLHNLEPRLHQWVVDKLSKSLESEVELGRVSLQLLPLRLRAENLTVRHHGRTDVPPLIVVSSFTVDLKPTELWSSNVERVSVEGLELNIPPKNRDGEPRVPWSHRNGSHDRDTSESKGLFIKRLTAKNARLALIPRRSDKNPKVWDIYELDVFKLGRNEPSAFTAALINPIPYGKVESTGQFGPWNSDEPGDSPLEGKYNFSGDLSTVDGIAGSIEASGTMSGTLDQIATTGETKTPDFRVTDLEGGSLPISTKYEALVDGTEGDVRLKRVDIQLGSSTMLADGIIIGTHGVKGKHIVVNITSQRSNLGELLHLVSTKRPPMQGVVAIKASFDLPQGEASVLERTELAGTVRADRVTFTDEGVQDKIDELSRRAQGRPNDNSIEDMASRLTATFSLRKSVLNFKALSFDVQGATVKLDGTHSLRSKALALDGVALLTAPVSKTMTGFKSWLLKPFDPLFRKNGAGTRLVIKVEGTQDQPKVKLDFSRTLRGS